MKLNRKKAVFAACLKKNLNTIILFVLMSFINLVIFILYDVKIEPFLYSVVMTLFFGIVLFTLDFIKETNRAMIRERKLSTITIDWNDLPQPENLVESDYQTMVTLLGKELDKVLTRFHDERQDLLDYYTSWVHQINFLPNSSESSNM